MNDGAVVQTLAPGTPLAGALVVGELLRRTARCLVYRGRDESLGLDVAIEEYFPRNLAVRREDGSVAAAAGGFGGQAYAAGLERFIDETRRFARIAGAPGLPQLRDALQGGGTAYRVTDWLDGIWLADFLARRTGGLARVAALRIVAPVLDALEAAHSVGLAHGAVGPATVVLCRTGEVKLLDFEGSGGPADDVRQAAGLLARLVQGAAEAELSAHEREALAAANSSLPGRPPRTIAEFRRALAGEPIPARAPETPEDADRTRLLDAAPEAVAAPEPTRLMTPADFRAPVASSPMAPAAWEPARATTAEDVRESAPRSAPEPTRLMTPSDRRASGPPAAPKPSPAPELTRLMTPADRATPAAPGGEKTRLLFSFEPPPAPPAQARPSEPLDPDRILTRIMNP